MQLQVEQHAHCTLLERAAQQHDRERWSLVTQLQDQAAEIALLTAAASIRGPPAAPNNGYLTTPAGPPGTAPTPLLRFCS